MIVSVDMDRMGCVTVAPVSERMNRRFKSKTAFLQRESDIDCFMENVSSAKQKSIRAGWTERIRMDEWVFGMMVGEENQ